MSAATEALARLGRLPRPGTRLIRLINGGQLVSATVSAIVHTEAQRIGDEFVHCRSDFFGTFSASWSVLAGAHTWQVDGPTIIVSRRGFAQLPRSWPSGDRWVAGSAWRHRNKDKSWMMGALEGNSHKVTGLRWRKIIVR